MTGWTAKGYKEEREREGRKRAERERERERGAAAASINNFSGTYWAAAAHELARRKKERNGRPPSLAVSLPPPPLLRNSHFGIISLSLSPSPFWRPLFILLAISSLVTSSLACESVTYSALCCE